MASELAELAADLVRIETENPPGDEAPCAEFVAEWFDECGVDAALVEEPDPERPQAVATVGDPEGEGPTLVLNGHTDVVPAGDREAWSHDPYAGEITDGRLYGRGAVDMKTGLALAMLAARDLAPDIESGDLDGALRVHAAMGEETGDPGTRALLDAGYGGDVAVVLEPTDFRVATRAKGVATYRVGVSGAASHASHPDEGTNALDSARPVLDAIDAYDARLREREDDLCGRAYATVTEFEAGTDSNMAVIPERAEFLLDRRILPDEEFGAVEDELDDLFASVEREAGVETHRELVQHYASAGIPDDAPVARRFRALSAELADAPDEPWGMEAATDAREFVKDGTDAIIWGPGNLSQAHAADEYVELDDAALGLEILERAARELLSA
ncbi:M20 family metallopeptidase [Halorussus salilacus]|uniref:M20 family metallopeptidase n=1 Tax=Halorussus salilacus TaxID=2953750 RepID=UPI00209CC175|nr:M20 family metallopeptidase [Halorussus salilacus]USZ67359.1 M20 family metallopeptidase [Halorussus salilacus]